MVVATLENVVRRPKPFNFAPVTIIEGEQKSGKSETAITRLVDPTFFGMTSVKLNCGSDKEIEVKAQPILNKEGYPIIGYSKLWLPNQEPQNMKIPPKSCVIAKDINIICNFHLYGIHYHYMKLPEIIKHLNDGMIRDCYLVIDEAYLAGDRRMGLSPAVKVISRLGWQLAKRHIILTMCLPDSSVLDLRFQKIETEHIVTSYDIESREITMYIQNRKKYKKIREVSYFAPTYWKYYNPDEEFEIPDIEMNRAIAMLSMEDK
jgi:hypothetical protein